MTLTKKHLIYLVSILVFIFGVYWYLRDTHENPKTSIPASPVVVDTSTSLEVIPKVTDEDLVVTQKYVATVNGQRMEAPIKTTTTGNTAVIKQEIDLTSVMKKLQPDWEVGAGLGVHEGDLYVPISIQRNYRPNKAVEVEVHYKPTSNTVNGGEVTHKWLF